MPWGSSLIFFSFLFPFFPPFFLFISFILFYFFFFFILFFFFKLFQRFGIGDGRSNEDLWVFHRRAFKFAFVWSSMPEMDLSEGNSLFLRQIVLICKVYRDRWNIDKRAWRLTRYWFDILRVVLSMRAWWLHHLGKGFGELRSDLIPFVQNFPSACGLLPGGAFD